MLNVRRLTAATQFWPHIKTAAYVYWNYW
jgi:hypothetical protein